MKRKNKDLKYYFEKHFEKIDFDKLQMILRECDLQISKNSFKKQILIYALSNIVINQKNNLENCKNCKYYLNNNNDSLNLYFNDYARVHTYEPTFEISENIRAKFRFDMDLDEFTKKYNKLMSKCEAKKYFKDIINGYMHGKTQKHWADCCQMKESTFNTFILERSQFNFDNIVKVICGLNINSDDTEEIFHYFGYHCPNINYITGAIAKTIIRMSIIGVLLELNVRNIDFINCILELNRLKPIKCYQ